GFVKAAQARIAADVKLPPGVSLEFTGAAEAQAAASAQILRNVAVAAIAIIALLVLAFGGGRAAMLILATAPFAVAGGVVAVAV
ncbi:efflux RND transporter permease subunit, partial [Acinetobacter baumannii]